MIAPEPITTVVKGDTIVLPVPIRSGVLPGIEAGTEVEVEHSFASENPGYWILHVYVPGRAPLSRSVSLNDEALVSVIG